MRRYGFILNYVIIVFFIKLVTCKSGMICEYYVDFFREIPKISTEIGVNRIYKMLNIIK